MKTYITLLIIITGPLAFGQNWHSIPSGTNQDLNSVHFINSQVGYIAGDDSLLLKTIDAGLTWNRLPVNLSFGNTRDIIDVYFETEQKGYLIVGPYGGLYRTLDSGATWQIDSLNNTNMCFKRSMYFNDLDNGYVGGSMCFQGETVAKRTNGTWATPQAIGSWNADDQITNFDFLDNQKGLATATGNYIFKTLDGGGSWDTAYSSIDTLGTTDVVFINDTLAYATHQTNGLDGILISTDGGSSWATDISAGTFYYPGFNCVAKDSYKTAYFGGYPSWGNDGIIFSKKMGEFWWYDQVDHPVNDIAVSFDSIVFAVGDSGSIVTNLIPNTIGIEKEESSFLKVYPNPTKGKFVVNGLNSEQSVSVFNTSGQKVFSQEPDDFEMEIDLTLFPSGLYLVYISTDKGIKTFKVLKE